MSAPAQAADAERKRDRRAMLAVVLTALLIRGVYLWESTESPTFDAPVVDSQTYDRLASELASGKGLSDEVFWQSCFYPLFLAGVYAVSHGSIVTAKLVQVGLGTATCGLCFLLARRVFDRASALATGLIAAMYGPLVFFETELVGAGWTALCAVGLILLMLVCGHAGQGPCPPSTARRLKWEEVGWWWYVSLGVVAAVATLLHPAFLAFGLLGLGWLAYRHRSAGARRVVAALGLTVLGFWAVAGPAAALCRRATGEAHLLPACGGFNLYLGNNADWRRTIAARPWSDYSDLRDKARSKGAVGIWSESRYFTHESLAYIREHPLGALAGVGYRVRQFVSAREMPGNVDMYLYRQWSRVLSVLTFKVGRWGFPFGAVFPLALAGLVLRWREVPGLIVVFLAVYALSISVSHVESRYRAPLAPLLAVLAGGGVVGLTRAVRERRWVAAVSAGSTAVAGLVLAVAPGPFALEGDDLTAELYHGRAVYEIQHGQGAAAIQDLKRALAVNPRFAESHNTLGACYLSTGQQQEALAAFARAVELNPDFAAAQCNLGCALAMQGQYAEAAAHLERAVGLMPWSVAAHQALGIVYKRQGRLAEAERELSEAVRLDPGNGEAARILGALRAQESPSKPGQSP